MFPVSPSAYNVSVVTSVTTNEDATLAVAFLFQGTSTTATVPAGTSIKAGDLVVTAYGIAHLFVIPSTQILGM